MPDCEENIKAIYHHAVMTEAMINTTLNKDREIVISKDYDPFMLDELDDCSGNNYILSFEFCDPDSNAKIRRNFVSYEGLSSTANYICSGSSLVHINGSYDYNVISGNDGWSIQKAIEALDASLEVVEGSGLNYLKDGPTDGSLIGSDGTNDSVVTGAAEHQINIGNYEGSMNNSPNSTITNGKGNVMTDMEYGFMGSGQENVMTDEAFGFMGSGRENLIERSYSAFIGTGEINKIFTGSDYSSILNGLNNEIKHSFVTMVNGNSGIGENHAETIFDSDVVFSDDKKAQYSTMVMNAITNDNSSLKALYLSDDVDDELITAPLRENFSVNADGGSLTGKLTLTGLYIQDTNKASTVRSSYLFSVVKNGTGSPNLELVDLGEKLQNSVGGAANVDVFDFTLDSPSNNKIAFNVRSNINADVLWTANVSANRQVKPLDESSIITTTPELTTTTNLAWNVQTIDSAATTGWYSSIAVDSNNIPHIAFVNKNSNLVHAKWNGSAWDITYVDISVVTIVDERRSIALDSNDMPGISYRLNASSGLKYAKFNGSTWDIETIDNAADASFSSLAFDSNDIPHIAYNSLNTASSRPKIAKWDGVSSWVIETIIDTNCGKFISIAIDSNDIPHVSYYQDGARNMKYAKRTSNNNWDKLVVDAGNNCGKYTSLALDSNDMPHIAYQYNSADLKYAVFNGSWNFENIDVGGGTFISLALNSSDNPSIGYIKNDELLYIKRDGVSSPWDFEIIDVNGERYTSLALDSNNIPHISYYGNGQIMKYASYV